MTKKTVESRWGLGNLLNTQWLGLFCQGDNSERIFVSAAGFTISEGTPTSKGYFRLKTKAHRDQYEHRVKLEKKLGRKLKPSEDTDHRDRNRGNNSPDNLRPVKHKRHPNVTFQNKSR